jgi:predicted permease
MHTSAQSPDSSNWFDALRHDVWYGVRTLLHSRRFASWVIGSLAIGMAITIAAVALLNALMVLPFPEVTAQNRLVRVGMSRNCGRPDCWSRMAAAADYDAMRDGLTGLQGLAAYTFADVTAGLPDARSLGAVLASANYFDVLGVHPIVGRAFDGTDAEARAAVAIIAHSLWTRELAADPTVIGRTIRVADDFVHVIGVAPPHFVGIDRNRPGEPRRIEVGRSPDIWLPMWLADRVVTRTAAAPRVVERDLHFVGRLQDGVELAELQAQAGVLAARLAAPSPAARAEVIRLWRVNPRNWRFGVLLVMPIPVLVLLIACVNAANLMLARGSRRQRDIAIRLAMGAGRGRIVRQLLIECALLALAATAIAVPIASWGLELASNPLDVPIPIDANVLTLTVIAAAATTLGFGLLPALRVSNQRPSSTLGPAGGRGDALPQQTRMRRLLVIAQIALSLGVLATGSQLVATVRSQAVSSGTPGDHLLIARFNLEPLNLTSANTDAFYRELLTAASRLPGVQSAGIARQTSVWTFGHSAARASIIVWRPTDAPTDGHVTMGGYAGGDLFDAVGLRLVAGRAFTDADRQLRPQVAIVNETAAGNMTGPAIGSVIRVAPPGRGFDSSIEVRIVGVIEAATEPRVEAGVLPAPKIYLPAPLETEPALALYLRTHARAAPLAQPFRELVGRIAPRVPIQEIGSLDEINERSYQTQLWLARAAAFLGVMGLLLATAGLYGVSSYVVAMRTREIAIRIAVGAHPGTIMKMVLGQWMGIAAIGLIAGGAAAAVVSRLIQSEYHGVKGIDGSAFGGAVALFVAAMLLASAIPAARASRVDPVESLKDT